VNRVCRKHGVEFDTLFDAPFKIDRSLMEHGMVEE
jgi:hypothetical protein